MSDGQTLLLVLALLYLYDCFLWVKKQSVAFVSPWGRRWRIASLNSSFTNANGGLLFLNPLPPLGGVFLNHLSPVSISPFGICAFNLQALPSVGRPAQTGRSLTFNEITGASADGAHLLVNNERFTKCATARQARAISELLNTLRAAKPAAREKMVQTYIVKQFRADEAAAILKDADAEIRQIRIACTILLVFLFVATPILVSILGLIPLLIPVALVMVVLAVDISIMFYGAHKKFYPADSQERVEGVVKMILCPPVAIRATDLFAKQLLSEYSPVVVATLLSGPRAEQFVRAFILDLQHPLKHEVSDDAAEIVTWAAREQLQRCLKHLKRSGDATPEDLLAPPAADDDSVSYCPRCGCQFLVRSGGCPDCPGVELVAFPKSVEAEMEGAA